VGVRVGKVPAPCRWCCWKARGGMVGQCSHAQEMRAATRRAGFMPAVCCLRWFEDEVSIAEGRVELSAEKAARGGGS